MNISPTEKRADPQPACNDTASRLTYDAMNRTLFDRLRFLLRGLREPVPSEEAERKALAAFRKYREARGEVLSAISLAQCLHVSGLTPEAERLFKDAYKLSRRAGLHAHIEPFT